MEAKNIKLITILFHSCILVIGGHGGGLMIMLDFVGITHIPAFFVNSEEFSLISDFGENLALAIIFSLLGKLFLVVSLFLKVELNKNVYTIMSAVFLLLSLYYLLSEYVRFSDIFNIVGLSSIPFLLCVGYLIIKTVRTIINPIAK